MIDLTEDKQKSEEFLALPPVALGKNEEKQPYAQAVWAPVWAGVT